VVAKTPKDLDSPDAKKSINTIFHIDEQGFTSLIKDFNGKDDLKKTAAENIIKAYYKMAS
jgi:recombinational DNA repair protein RecT